MSELEFPSVGYKTKDGKGWVAPPEDEAIDECNEFFGKPEDQNGEIVQATIEPNFDYFQKMAPQEESHNRIWLCTQALHEHLDPEAPHGFEGGFNMVYFAATLNGVTDDRILAWRNKPEDPKVLKEIGNTKVDLSSAQYFNQMITWCKSKGMTSSKDLSFVLDSMGVDHEDTLNFAKNFKPYRQHLWGSMANNEQPS